MYSKISKSKIVSENDQEVRPCLNKLVYAQCLYSFFSTPKVVNLTVWHDCHVILQPVSQTCKTASKQDERLSQAGCENSEEFEGYC